MWAITASLDAPSYLNGPSNSLKASKTTLFSTFHALVQPSQVIDMYRCNVYRLRYVQRKEADDMSCDSKSTFLMFI